MTAAAPLSMIRKILAAASRPETDHEAEGAQELAGHHRPLEGDANACWLIPSRAGPRRRTSRTPSRAVREQHETEGEAWDEYRGADTGASSPLRGACAGPRPGRN